MHYTKTIGRVIYALKAEHALTSPGSERRRQLWAEIKEAIEFYWSPQAEEFNTFFKRRLNRDFEPTAELDRRYSILKDDTQLLSFWRSYDKTHE
jgi:hypothetical protein